MKDTDIFAMSFLELLNEPNVNVMEVNTYEAYVSDITDPYDIITSNFNSFEIPIIENIVLTSKIMEGKKIQIELIEKFISHANANAEPCKYTSNTPDLCTCRYKWYEPADLKNIAHTMKNNNPPQGFEDFYYNLRHIDNNLINIDEQYRSHLQNFVDKLKENHKQEIVKLCNLLYQSINKQLYILENVNVHFEAKTDLNFHNSSLYIDKKLPSNVLNESQTSKSIISTIANAKLNMDNFIKYLKKHKIQEDTKTLSSAYFNEIKLHYLSFITYVCYNYDATNESFSFKKCLWGIHTYMAEFFFYIMWKFKRLSITPHHLDGFPETKYTKHLIKEIQDISNFLNQYYMIRNEYSDLKLEKICILIYKFRQNIYKFLQLFYSNDIATTMYHIATRSDHRNVINRDYTPDCNTITDQSMGLPKYLTQVEQIKHNKLDKNTNVIYCLKRIWH